MVHATFVCSNFSYGFANGYILSTETEGVDVQDVFRECAKCRVMWHMYVSGKFIYKYHLLKMVKIRDKHIPFCHLLRLPFLSIPLLGLRRNKFYVV